MGVDSIFFADLTSVLKTSRHLLSENRQNKLNFSKEDVNHVCKIATLLKQDISKLRLQSLFAEYGLCSIRSSMA